MGFYSEDGSTTEDNHNMAVGVLVLGVIILVALYFLIGDDVKNLYKTMFSPAETKQVDK